MNEAKRRNPGKIILIVLCALCAGVIVLLGVMKKKPKDVKAVEEVAAAVSVLPVRAMDVTNRVTIPGRVEAWVEANLAAEKPGRIVELPVDKGQAVHKGDLLLKLDDRSWNAIAEKAEIDLRDAQKDLDRWNELKKTGAVSQDGYEEIRSRQELARIALTDGKVQLQRCEVRSPIDGIVADRLVEEGEYVNDGQLVFSVVTVDPVKLVLDVPERDMVSLRDGDILTFVLDALPGQVFEGRITFIAPTASRQSNSFRVEASVPNAEGTLKPGMIARALLQRGVYQNAVSIPLGAIIPRKGEYVVFVAEGDRAARRLVKIDTILGQDALIADGIRSGDHLIVEGGRTLRDGALIQVQNGVLEAP